MSHGAGVLLGNYNYGVEDLNLLRELNDSRTTGNLKSVYDMRVSHSNLAKTGGGAQSKPPQAGGTKAKRKHLQSAITRSNKPQNLTGLDTNNLS